MGVQLYMIGEAQGLKITYLPTCRQFADDSDSGSGSSEKMPRIHSFSQYILAKKGNSC